MCELKFVLGMCKVPFSSKLFRLEHLVLGGRGGAWLLSCEIELARVLPRIRGLALGGLKEKKSGNHGYGNIQITI